MKTDNQIKQSFDEMLEKYHPEYKRMMRDDKRMKEDLKEIKSTIGSYCTDEDKIDNIRTILFAIDNRVD